ncbi:MAG: EamA family transporter [Rhizobiaceae bacterium]|nr:EamA family transporter [Rhizobiaceae bacterium]
MNRAVLFLILFTFGIMWGATIPLTKIVVSTGHHPFGLIFWQSLISVIVLYPLLKFRRSKLIIDRKHLLFFGTIAFTGTLIPNSTSYLAAFHLPAGVMALIIALVPMFALLIALTLKLEQFSWKRLSGVVLGAAAIALIVLPNSSLPDPSKAIFVIIALLGPFCYAIEGNYLSVKQPADTGPIATLFGASVIGTIVSFVVVLISGTFINPLETGISAPELSLLATILLHIAAYTGYIWLVGKAGVVFSTQVAYVVTPAGVLLSVLFLGERNSAYIWLALAILLIGLFLVQPRQKQST